MKIKFFLSLLLLSAGLLLNIEMSCAQTDPSTFVVKPGNDASLTVKIQKAAEESSLDIYRLRNKQRELVFENGAVIVLYSAEELKSKGKNIDLSAYPEDTPKGYKEPVYALSADGKLVQYYQPLDNGKNY